MKNMAYVKVVNKLEKSDKWIDLSRLYDANQSVSIIKQILVEFSIDQYEDMEDDQFK